MKIQVKAEWLGHEAIGRGDLPNAVAQIKIQEEMAAVEKLKESIKRNGTYGKNEVAMLKVVLLRAFIDFRNAKGK